MGLDDDTYRAFAAAARADGRSLANLIQRAALLKIQEDQFVDDAEMAEILAIEAERARNHYLEDEEWISLFGGCAK
jgi:hypothetical protein